MVPGHRPRLGIFRVVVAHHQSVHGEGVLLRRDFLGKGVDDAFNRPFIRRGHQSSLHGVESQLVEPVHACSPAGDVLFRIHQCEGNPADVAVLDVLRVFHRQRPRSQVPGVGIVLAALHHIAFEVVVRDHCLASDDDMSLGGNLRGNAADGPHQVRDVRADVAVAARDDLRQPPIVVGHHQRQSVQLPRYPDAATLGPFHQLVRLLRLRQRQRGEFVLLLLTRDGVFRYALCRRVGQGSARLRFQPFQLVEPLVPLVVRHLFRQTVVIGLAGLVQLPHELLHPLYLVVHNGYCFFVSPAKVRKSE